ncbi:pseudoazurin [Methylobacterium sp. A54F]
MIKGIWQNLRALAATSLLTTIASISLAIDGRAAEVVVKTLNSGPAGSMVFDPPFVKLAPGDSIKLVPSDKGHNIESIKGMAPEGTPVVKTTVGKEETITLEKEGVYGFKCSPHYLMGMVALVVVGANRDNLEQAKSVQHGKLAAKRFEPLFAQLQ